MGLGTAKTPQPSDERALCPIGACAVAGVVACAGIVDRHVISFASWWSPLSLTQAPTAG